jgi:hypothetical protein
MRKRKTRLRRHGLIDTSTTKRCRSAQPQSQENYILFERFQIALPLEKIGIILHANLHYPVVPANTQQ